MYSPYDSGFQSMLFFIIFAGHPAKRMFDSVNFLFTNEFTATAELSGITAPCSIIQFCIIQQLLPTVISAGGFNGRFVLRSIKVCPSKVLNVAFLAI